MPHIKINGCNYYYIEEGRGDETIVFSHGLLWNHKMFIPQINHLKDRYRIIAYDHRGQGQSEVTDSGYDMDQLYRDALELINRLDLGKVHFVGLSMGGFVAMRLAARNPDIIRSLILMETSAMDEPNKLKYSILKFIVQAFGTKPVVGRVMKIMFGKKFLIDGARVQQREQLKMDLINLDKTIVKAVNGVIHRDGIESELKNILCPTLVMVGTQDIATVPAKAEFIHNNIPHSQLKYIEGAGHTSSLEEPITVNQYFDEFLLSLS